MKSRSTKSRNQKKFARPRVFVTPAMTPHSHGGVYTASGRPVAVPTQIPQSLDTDSYQNELDDWVPEPESFMSDDDMTDDFDTILPDDDDLTVDETQATESVVEETEETTISGSGSSVSSPVGPNKTTWPGEFVGEVPQESSIPVRVAGSQVQSTVVRWRRK